MTRGSMERQSEARLFRRSPVPPDTAPILTIQGLRRDINQVHAISQRNIRIFNTRAQYTYIQQRKAKPSQQLLESSHPLGRHHRHRHLILPSRLRHLASSRSLDRGTHVPREAEPGPRLHEAVDFFYLIES